MTFSPPLYRNGVEVTSLVPESNKMNLIIHVAASSKEEINSFECQRVIKKMVQQTIYYLEMEGFIEKKEEKWLTQLGIVLHPPGSDNFQNA